MHIWLRCMTRLVALSVGLAPLAPTPAAPQDRLRVASPDGRTQVTVEIRDGGLYYSLNRDTRPLFLPSPLPMAFRVFDDGIGFRCEFPQQPGRDEFAITDELTEFTLEDDARAWWIPSNRPRLDRSEMLFSSSPVSVLDSVQTPLTLETRDDKSF